MNINEILKKIVDKKSLTVEEAEGLAKQIINGQIPEILTSAILVALRMKGESSDEIVGFAKAMREMAIKINVPNAVDTAGTGGDGFGTVNVSTAVAILLSLINPVAKHGNKAISSKSGSADFLEALGYNITIGPERAKELISKYNFVFLFAPLYHPAMKNVANVRRTLGIRTIFNILGPLTNPAGAKYQLMGVFSKDYADLLAESISVMDFDKVILVHGEPGIDEVTLQGKTYLYIVKKSSIEKLTLNVSDFGIDKVPIDKLIANSAEDSAIRVLRASIGKDEYVEKFIRVNASVGLFLLGKVSDFKEGYNYAGELLKENFVEKIKELISANGDVNKLNNLLVKAIGN